jgi:hypothetical protein
LVIGQSWFGKVGRSCYSSEGRLITRPEDDEKGDSMKGMLVVLAVTLLGASASYAQTTGSNNIFAQKLVDEITAKHPELNIIGLHSTPPNGAESVIVACSNKKKVGKKSDPDDLQVMQSGKPTVEEKKDRQIYDLGFPLLDQNGTTIGVLVMEIKFSFEKTSEGALQRGKQIQSELQKQIPSKAKLFETTQ